MSFIENGKTLTLHDITATHDNLPKGVYILKFDDKIGYYLAKKEDFSIPDKIYGDQSIIDRWLKSLEVNTSKNLGILLTGLKGSGKTITAQKFCNDSNLPVILINNDFSGPEFLDFMSNPELGKCIIFIDEYEKIYAKVDKQFDLLSLMDGTFQTTLVFLMTVNNYKINEYLVNRLGRIKYVKQYSDLDFDTINEVIDDCLENKKHRESIFEFFELVNIRTFDILINLIKEMNLFKEDALVCGHHLNLRCEPRTYNVVEIVNGVEYSCWNTTMAPNSEYVSFERKNIDYVPPKSKGEIVSWEVELKMDECVVEKIGEMSRIIKHPIQGVFKFKEVVWGDYSLVF